MKEFENDFGGIGFFKHKVADVRIAFFCMDQQVNFGDEKFDGQQWVFASKMKPQMKPSGTRIGDSRSTSNILRTQRNLSALPVLCPKEKTNKYESIHVLHGQKPTASTIL